MSVVAEPTVVVELTPQGRGAVAVVVVDGPNAREAVRQFFVPVTQWNDDDPKIGRIAFGRWGGDRGEELIVCRRDEHQFEIHCHGGGAAAPAIIEQLESRGCRQVKWQEWLRRKMESQHGGDPPTSTPQRTFDRRDAATVGAQIALANATTLRAATVLLDQYHRALLREVAAAREAVAAADWERAGNVIDGVLRFRDVGLHLTSPWRVVLAGAPNVGKSSLINAIAGYQRAIVSPTPGTTRDIVTVNTAINGWPVQLADTAGLRVTDDELESAGVALANAEIHESDLVVFVLDASASSGAEQAIDVPVADATRVIRVWNKVDLMPDPARGCFSRQPDGQNARLVSALTGEGVPELIAAIGAALVPLAPPAGAAVPFMREQVASLDSARTAVCEHDVVKSDAALAALLAFK